MLCFPNCKINLGLYITEKRPDGYHDLETVFYPLQLKDALEVVPALKTKLHLSGKAVAGNDQDNLVWKAYQLLKKDFPAIPPLDIYLHKAIPMGAGLGGGSANGAFMLRLLNEHCKLGITDTKLAEYALQLGSDCPFFIYNTPQFASGRGEKMEPLSIDLSAFSIQLIYPEVHISTAAAFGMITPKPASFDLRKLTDVPIADWRQYVSNDFETPVFAQHSELAAIKDQLYEQGAIYASMSGSGSTIYGIFPKGRKAVVQISTPLEEHYIS
jgi:4-diphosphocytidyl-2-C-methyl-D-erythritol kinase